MEVVVYEVCNWLFRNVQRTGSIILILFLLKDYHGCVGWFLVLKLHFCHYVLVLYLFPKSDSTSLLFLYFMMVQLNNLFAT